MRLIDFRSPEDYINMNFPNSVNMKNEDLFGKDAAALFSKKNAVYLFIADTEEMEKRSAYIAAEIGYENVFILSEGLNGFTEKIINFRNPGNSGSRHDADVYRFREKASILIPEIIKANKDKGTQKKTESKRVLGGC
ncbi:MAG: rhodanese-like domain-containing protein [Ignavibacteria bacterium]|nr:rhodanese-like domain-containing protein [Ignavibacteria bacterium]